MAWAASVWIRILGSFWVIRLLFWLLMVFEMSSIGCKNKQTKENNILSYDEQESCPWLANQFSGFEIFSRWACMKSLLIFLGMVTALSKTVWFLKKFFLLQYNLNTQRAKQHAKKVMSDSPGLVDFAIGIVIFVLNLPNRQVLFFFGKFTLQKDYNQSCNQKGFWD